MSAPAGNNFIVNVEKRPLAQPITSRAPERQTAYVAARPLVEALALVALLVVALVGLLNADRLRNGPSVDFADSPVESSMDLIGINLAETNGVYTYRWTTGYMFAQIPHGLNAAQSYIATTRFRAANPAGPQPLTFLANERPLATTTPSTAFRTYRMLVSAPPSDDGSLRFALQTTPFTTTADTRKLGVMMTSIALKPVHSFDWIGALVLVAALAALWAWLRWRGARLRDTLLICGLVSGALLVLSATYRPAPLTFPLLGVLALLGCAAGAWLARDVWSRLALVALALLMTFSGVLWPSWMTDDAIISFRYAENLVAGNGLVYNVGERVEGYTNFLWTMLAALLLWLGGDPVWWAYVSGVVLALAILLLTYWLARWLLSPAWALVAALFVATSQSLLIYTARGAGLETGLFTLLVLAGSALVIKEEGRRKKEELGAQSAERRAMVAPHPLTRSPAHPLTFGLIGLIFALATLTRPEGALVMALTVGYVAWRQRDKEIRRQGLQSTICNLQSAMRSVLPLIVGYLLIF
ncbi:MAG TPA: hypothetical protein VFT66_00795, partial [Roseiflexaceae bacterium]|nr:hypothetical protein [Roseiflexaceae bacterium]